MDKITTIKFRRDLLIALAEDIISKNKELYAIYNKDKEAQKDIDDTIEYYEHFIKSLNEDFEKGRYSKISMWYNGGINDISDDFDFLLSHRQQFIDKYDFDLLDLNKKRREKVDKIVASGKIKTDNQYYLIMEYVDDLCQVVEDKELIDKLNEMIIDYEERVAARMAKRKNK